MSTAREVRVTPCSRRLRPVTTSVALIWVHPREALSAATNPLFRKVRSRFLAHTSDRLMSHTPGVSQSDIALTVGVSQPAIAQMP